MKGNGFPQLKVTRLKGTSVVCQVDACEKAAEFTVRDATEVVTAFCREHLTALGIADEDIPSE